MGGTSSDSDSGSGSESSAHTDSQFESLAGPRNSFGETVQLSVSGKHICDSG